MKKVLRSLFAFALVASTFGALGSHANAGKVCWDDGAGGETEIHYKC